MQQIRGNKIDAKTKYKVTNMSGMFEYAKKFNSNISNWNVSNVTDMYRMFSDADNFKQDISKWNLRKVGTYATDSWK